MRTFIIILGIALMLFGVGHIVYMEYWVYGDVQTALLTPRQTLNLWWLGALAIFIGYVLFKIGTND